LPEKVYETVDKSCREKTDKRNIKNDLKCDVNSDVTIQREQFLYAAVEHNCTDLVSLLLSMKRYKSMLAKFPTLARIAVEAGNINVAATFLTFGVPHTWLEEETRNIWLEYYQVLEDIDNYGKLASFSLAVRGACYWNQMDVFRCLVKYYLTEKRYD